MSSRYEAYKDRVHYKGKTKREYVKKKVEESIESLITDSQYGFTINVKGQDQEVAILSTKTTQEYEAANIIAPLSVGLEKGVVFSWDDNNWIVLKKMFRPDQPGFNGIAYRCNGYLKWIDEKTQELIIQPAYIRSGRITNALGVTPDKNQTYDNIIMHDTDWNMMAATPANLKLHPEMRFIIKGQAYRVTNVDNVSIDNVSILSFVDDRLLDSDDVVEMIAYNDEYGYKLYNRMTEDTQMYVGDIKELPIVVLFEGKPVDESFWLESDNSAVVEVSGNQLIGRACGIANITAHLTKNDTITLKMPVTVGETHVEQTEQLYIDGNDYIDWNSTEIYTMSDKKSYDFAVEVQSKVRKTIEYLTNEEGAVNGVKIHIEDKYSGKIMISCQTEQGLISKTVYIRTV